MRMDFFDSQYFSINKKFLKAMGLWPYQNRLQKILRRTPFVLFLMVSIVPQIISITLYLGVDIRKVLQAIAVLFYVMMVCSKIVMYTLTEDKLQDMYEYIAQNWQMIKKEEEVQVLRKSSEYGRFLTIGYMVYMFSALITFITIPMLPSLMDKIDPLNVSRPLIFILEGEYFVDRSKNYNKIYIFESLTCITTVFVFNTTDTTYAVCVQQCIGLMKVVKTRLGVTKNILVKQSDKMSESKDMVAGDKAIIEAVQFHQKAIDFANVMEAAFSINFLVVICINAVTHSVGSAILVMNLNRPLEFLRFVMIYIGLMIHILYLSWPGQQLIDACDSLLNETYNNKWYEFSIDTQKNLKFMMMRCKVPCQLTAGGRYVMNVANCGVILKASLSYITVFASMVD